jgi:hypothetical protein
LCLSLRFLGRIRRHGFLFYGADDVDSNMCSEPFGMKSNTVGSIKGRYDGMHENDIESSSTPYSVGCMRVAAEAEGLYYYYADPKLLTHTLSTEHHTLTFSIDRNSAVFCFDPSKYSLTLPSPRSEKSDP